MYFAIRIFGVLCRDEDERNFVQDSGKILFQLKVALVDLPILLSTLTFHSTPAESDQAPT